VIKLITQKYNLIFKLPAGTSRGILKTKPSWFFILYDSAMPEKISIGECGILPGLSIDDKEGYKERIQFIAKTINESQNIDYNFNNADWPSIRFGLEILRKDYHSKNDKILFETDFTEGLKDIKINGLIWMGEKKFMFDQIKSKIEDGWSCIKMKIGAIDFEEEIKLLKYIRSQFTPSQIELRVDANGAFSSDDALEKLKTLSDLNIHSIEQPIKAGNIDMMAKLCNTSPLPIALDEELIGINNINDKEKLIKAIKPQYIILKPSLIGGWKASDEWINIAKKHDVKFWATSALESNIGLNAIAQWTAAMEEDLVHGLGTGQLYTNNIDSPLSVNSGNLSYDKSKVWNIERISQKYK